MMATTARKPLTLAIHPSFSGFGWIAMEGPLSPYDWGLAFTEIDKNANCLKRIERLFDRFMPETLVLEAFETARSPRSDRTKALCRATVALAQNRGIDVAVYTRSDIHSTFSGLGAYHRQDIAEAVGRHISLLQKLVPKRRRTWEHQPHILSMFAAAAAALTHYRLSCDRLLDQLRDAGSAP